MPAPLDTELDLALRPLSRRRLLQGAALGAAAVAACTPATEVTAPGALDAAERAIFTRLIAVLLPVKEFGFAPVSSVPVMENIDRLIRRLNPKIRKDFGAGLMLFDYGAVVIGWNFTRFSKLSDAAAEAYCARWQSGGEIQRGLFGALKQIVGMSYWREPATWPAIGYEGPVTARYGLPRLGDAPPPKE